MPFVQNTKKALAKAKDQQAKYDGQCEALIENWGFDPRVPGRAADWCRHPDLPRPGSKTVQVLSALAKHTPNNGGFFMKHLVNRLKDEWANAVPGQEFPSIRAETIIETHREFKANRELRHSLEQLGNEYNHLPVRANELKGKTPRQAKLRAVPNPGPVSCQPEDNGAALDEWENCLPTEWPEAMRGLIKPALDDINRHCEKSPNLLDSYHTTAQAMEQGLSIEYLKKGRNRLDGEIANAIDTLLHRLAGRAALNRSIIAIEEAQEESKDQGPSSHASTESQAAEDVGMTDVTDQASSAGSSDTWEGFEDEDGEEDEEGGEDDDR